MPSGRHDKPGGLSVMSLLDIDRETFVRVAFSTRVEGRSADGSPMQAVRTSFTTPPIDRYRDRLPPLRRLRDDPCRAWVRRPPGTPQRPVGVHGRITQPLSLPTALARHSSYYTGHQDTDRFRPRSITLSLVCRRIENSERPRRRG